ncbi:MAG: hypothetical protein ACHP6I_03860 [Rickettsiales bacterium]
MIMLCIGFTQADCYGATGAKKIKKHKSALTKQLKKKKIKQPEVVAAAPVPVPEEKKVEEAPKVEQADFNVINIAFTEDVPAAAFIRGGHFWLVFGKNVDVDASKITHSVFKGFQVAEKTDHYTTLVSELDEKVDPLPTFVLFRKDFNWVLEVTKTPIKPKESRVISRPLAAPFPSVDIEIEEVAKEAITITDTYVGDSLIILPFTDNASAILNDYRFIDFDILPSIQGIVIQPFSDSFVVRAEDKKYTIVSSAGLNIASRVYQKSADKFATKSSNILLDDFVQDYNTILSVKSYEVTDGTFNEKLLRLKNKLSKTYDRTLRSKLMTNWAMLYLANGFYTEGLIVTRLLRQEDPEFASSYQFQVIEVALQFMDDNYLVAYELARKIDVLGVPVNLRKEARFWQAITAFMVSDANDYLYRIDPISLYSEKGNNFLSQYNDGMLLELGIAISINKIAQKQFNEAQVVIKNLQSLNVTRHNKNRVYSITAQYFAAIDKNNEALEAWDKCAADYTDLLNRVKCRYDRANFLKSTKRMDDDKYIEELEHLSIMWRGDEMEIGILRDLGDTYYEMKQYDAALRSWNVIVTYYPYSPDSLHLSRRMGETFTNFFVGGKDDEISHLKALAIFYEFEKLVPIGELGDAVVLKFADHLIALDLLDRAAAILSHQVQNRLKGYRKEEAINKLAEVYLKNDDARLAIDIMRGGESYTILPDHIGNKRKYLLAQAYFENLEPKNALEILQGDYSKEADDIKSEIYWAKKDWVDFNKFAEPRIYEIRDANDVLSDEDAARVLKLQISYLTSDNYDLMESLYKDFAPRMPQGKRNTKIFETIADSWRNISSGSREEISSNIQTIKTMVDDMIKIISPTTVKK